MDNVDLAIKAAIIKGDITNAGIVDKTRSIETWKLITLRNSAGKTLSKIPVSRVASLRDQGAKFSDEEEKSISDKVSIAPPNKIVSSTDSQKVTAIACSIIAVIAIGAAINYGLKENEKRKQRDALSACSRELSISLYRYNKCLNKYGYQSNF